MSNEIKLSNLLIEMMSNVEYFLKVIDDEDFNLENAKKDLKSDMNKIVEKYESILT